MTADRLLLVDDDAERRGRFQAILECLSPFRTDATASNGWAGENADDLMAVLVGACPTHSIDAELKALGEWAQATPVLVYGLESDEPPPGAVATLPYPPSYEQLTHVLHRAQVLREHRANLLPENLPAILQQTLVGNSTAMRQVRRMINQVADSEANVLILGESGTGKEVVARNLHFLSSRRQQAFVPVNCGAIPGELLESELFGHEKGAFTGAITSRQGRFELAEGGTLFLDEIGDMPLPMQVKLLRVLQERTFERVGSNKSLNADVRVVAATHRDLESRIADGTFREDLYYRLNVFPIEMPALRERREDVPLLVNEFIHRLERDGRGSVRLTNAAVRSLEGYRWPGNVRELANLIERLVIMFPQGVVDYRDLPEKFQVEGVEPDDSIMPLSTESAGAPAGVPSDGVGLVANLPAEGLDLKEYLADLEQSLIQQALDDADHVVAHAAKRLKMRRTTLVEKMRKYGLQRAEA